MPRVRRTQEERSAATRGRLLDATIDCLFDLGYANTTTVEIARRARLSRGAQLHHFPTKEKLVTTAVDHLFAQRRQEFLVAFARIPEGENRAKAAVDLLWQMFSGPTFYAWLELVVAARTDPELRKAVSSIALRFAETVQRTFEQLFGPPRPGVSAFLDVAPMFTFALLQGLALDRIVAEDDPRLVAVLDRFKALATMLIPAGPGREPR
jgi:AcrR family transcriptional regulator